MDIKLLTITFVFLMAGCLIVPLAQRFRLGSVLGYLIAGIAIAPLARTVIGVDAEGIMHFAEIGVIMMMFLIGMELEPAVLWRLRKSIIGLGGLQVTLTSAALMAAGFMMGQTWQASLAIGMALSLSSTALVMQMLNEKNLTHTLVGETSFSVLLFQDIAVIPILIIIPLLAVGTGGAVPAESHSLIAHWPVWLQPLAVVAVIAGVILAGRYLSRYVFLAIAKANLREVFTAISLAIVIGVTILMELIGMSPALGAFIAGVVLASSQYRRTIETDIEPFKGLLLGLFFISVGMGMDFSVLMRHPLAMLGAVIGLMTVKGLILYVLGSRFGVTGAQGIGLAIGLAQGGEFAFVLLQLIGGLNIIDAEAQKFLILLVALSIGFTPILVALFSRFVMPRFVSQLPERAFDVIDETNPVIIAGFGRFGQVVGRFLLSQGVAVTVLEKNPDQVETVGRFGFKAYFGDATRMDLLHSAGIREARMLIVAVDDADAAVDIVRQAKEHYPRLLVFARARNRRHAYDLHKAGVDAYHREMLDASLALAREAMVALGRDAAEVERKAAKFLAHDIQTLKTSFEFFESEPELINFAKLSREELERILREDKQDGEAQEASN
ncbi:MULTISPECIES: monovalent cation:proton antiporter-2 (CPA2) family protein [Asticcacaulis]|uniref:monovalent cation:proton antiporter-2 (CPA2) family protein n=1 Tax=Asticcacaulis TaxID=76890 RepID=UPI001AE44C4E|nr:MULTISPECIES: monovalent cation:proton antiporter-2 (CPA2) family protein [Asticcacaulis]MBP2158620.1 CPA2 family monovalent cation:H+ antiporter-2/glutathione-regulated potassium-efflux system ancillary protein KefC [Asticcacaulis solisilvae]MDR6799666.1 CPA2 family monovalent cation:H+ antiporter-2/glutathione-regulated potassium-efflux system ancillary protein KefC [Asticcacaulis sp. BE141]